MPDLKPTPARPDRSPVSGPLLTAFGVGLIGSVGFALRTGCSSLQTSSLLTLPEHWATALQLLYLFGAVLAGASFGFALRLLVPMQHDTRPLLVTALVWFATFFGIGLVLKFVLLMIAVPFFTPS